MPNPRTGRHARQSSQPAAWWELWLTGADGLQLAGNPLPGLRAPDPWMRGGLVAAAFIIGIASGVLCWSNGPRMMLRLVVADVLAAVLVCFSMARTTAWWFDHGRLDAIELTELTDGELAHGIWAEALVPVVRALVAAAVGESIAILASGWEARPGGLLVVLAALPFCAAFFHAGTGAMLAPRLLFAAAESATAHGYGLRMARALAESYALVILITIATFLTGMIGALLFLIFSRQFLPGFVLLMLLMVGSMKRLVSASYAYGLTASWRVWTQRRREFERDPEARD